MNANLTLNPAEDCPHHVKIKLNATTARQWLTQLASAVESEAPIEVTAYGTLELSSPSSITLAAAHPIPRGWESV